MTFENPLPWWALLGIVAAAGGVAWAAYRHAALAPGGRLTLSVLRFLTLAVLIVLLMRPVTRVAGGGTDALVPVLVDTSRSMSIEDAAGARRIDRAREILATELLPALSPRFQVELLAFGESLRSVEPDGLGASARSSDLGGALRSLAERYRGKPVAGIVLVSDGGDTAGTVVERAADGPAAVYPIGIGSTTAPLDREILSVTAADAVLDDSRVDLAVSAVSHGFGTAPLEVRLLENGRLIDIRRVPSATDGVPVREVFQVEPGRGAPTVYTVELPAAPEELVPENNARSVLVQPPARPRRVLLVQGAPGHEHSFLRRAWRGDQGLDIDTIVRQGRNEQGKDTFYIQAGAARSARLAGGFPAGQEDLFAYDVVVLANVEGTFLTPPQLEATREFVARRGGGLLVLGARSFAREGLVNTPLENVVPLEQADRSRGVSQASSVPAAAANRVQLTPAGEAHPITRFAPDDDEARKRWARVPALAAVSPLGAPRPGAVVLAVSGGPGGIQRPLVAVQRFGEGRSMVFTGEASWRWRMQLPADDRSYDTFWRQAVRWLALRATDPVAISVPDVLAPGESVPLRVIARTPGFEPLRDASVEFHVTGPGGQVETLTAALDDDRGPGSTFAARYQPDGPGVYRVRADVRQRGSATASGATSMLVGGADLEMADPRLNLRLLQRLAAASGGRVVQSGNVPALTAALEEATPAALLLARRDLWHNGWSFGLVMGLLAVEWVVRRRWGFR